MKSSAFAVPAFRRLWAAGFVSDAGDWLLFIALPLVVLRLSGSALSTSLAFLLELIPAVALAPIAARLVDRFDRRTIMVATNVLQALALLPLLTLHTRADLPIAYGVIIAQAALSTVFEPAKNALLPDLVPSDRLVSANALTGLNQNLGRLVGGPLGGVLLAVGDLGLVVAVDAVSYALSAVLIFTVPSGLRHARSTVGADSEPVSESHAAVGILPAVRRPRLRGAFVVALVSGAAQGMFLVLFVLFVVGPLHGSDAQLGLLRGIQAVGAIAAGIALGLLSRTGTSRSLTGWSTIVFGLISLVTWNLPFFTTGFWPYVVLFIIVGAPGVVLATGLVSGLQQESLDRERGSVFAAFGLLSALGQAVGMLAAGALVDVVGLTALLEIQAVLYLLAGVAAFWLMPRHVRAQSLALP